MSSEMRDGDLRPIPVEPLLAFADGLLAERPGDAPRSASEISQFVGFMLGEAEYGIPILQCREIVRVGAITRIPEAPEQVRGVVNLRGHLVPAVDTRRCLGLEPANPTARSRLIVVEVSGRQFGLLVDRVARILKLATSEMDAATDAAASPGVIAVGHVDGATVQLLDAERVLRGHALGLAPKEGDKP